MTPFAVQQGFMLPSCPRATAPAPAHDSAHQSERPTAPWNHAPWNHTRMHTRHAVTAATIVMAAVALLGPATHAGQLSAEPKPLATLSTRDAHALLWLPDGRLLLGHHDGVQVSSNQGRTWKTLLKRPNFDAMNLQRDGNTLVLAGHDVYATSADGRTWKTASTRGLGGTDLHGYAVSPVQSGLHYAWEARTGLHASRDGGRTWVSLAPRDLPGDIIKLTAAKGALYAVSARAGVWLSTDGARSFRPVPAPVDDVLTVEVGPDGSVWIGARSGVWRASSGTWAHVSTRGALALAVNPKSARDAVWVTIDGQVLRSVTTGKAAP